MKTAKQLREERATKIQAMQALHAKATAENRSLSAEERTQWTSLNGEVEGIDSDLVIAERQEQLDLQNASRAIHTGQTGNRDQSAADKKDIQKFSFLRAARISAGMETFDGIEKEMHDQAASEYRNAGIGTIGMKGINIPFAVLNEKRDLTATGGTGGNQGGVAIATELRTFIEALEVQSILTRAGARFESGLIGNIDWPEQTNTFRPAWATENGAAQEGTLTFGKKSSAPKRLAGFIDVSEQILIQTSPSIEGRVRANILQGTALAYEEAAINGSGSAPTPLGLLNAAGTIAVVGGANGALPTRDHLIALMKAPGKNNYRAQQRGSYITNDAVVERLLMTKTDAGSGKFVLENDGDSFMGSPFLTSQIVPGNLTKGTAAGICSALVYGDFSQLFLGMWGGINVLADPYTQKGNALLRLHVAMYGDVLVLQPKAFSVMKDVLVA